MSTYLHTCTNLVQNAAGANLPNSSTNWIITPPMCSSLLTRSVLSTWRSVTRTRSSQEPSIINPFILLTFDTSLTSNPAGQHIQNKQLSVSVLFSTSFQQIALGEKHVIFQRVTTLVLVVPKQRYITCAAKSAAIILVPSSSGGWKNLTEDLRRHQRTYRRPLSSATPALAFRSIATY